MKFKNQINAIIVAIIAMLITTFSCGRTGQKTEFDVPEGIVYSYGTSNIPPLVYNPTEIISEVEIKELLWRDFDFNMNNDTILIIDCIDSERSYTYYKSCEDTICVLNKSGHNSKVIERPVTQFSPYFYYLINIWNIEEFRKAYDEIRAGILRVRKLGPDRVITRILIVDGVARMESIEFVDVEWLNSLLDMKEFTFEEFMAAYEREKAFSENRPRLNTQLYHGRYVHPSDD